MLEYQNIKIFFQNVTLHIGQKKLKNVKFVIKKGKILYHGHMLLVILKENKLLEHFMKTNCKKTNQKEFRIGKVIKRKGDKLYVKWKGYDSSFNSWID